jgi:hypothetical protein
VVDVIAGRERLDLPDRGMLEAAREHDVTVQPPPPRRDLRERHPHLKGDARLLGKHDHRPDRLDRRPHLLEQRANLGGFPSKWCSRSCRAQACDWLQLANCRPRLAHCHRGR